MIQQSDMIRHFDTNTHTLTEIQTAFSTRLSSVSEDAEKTVRDILHAVRTEGDEAILAYTRRFDYPTATELRVSNVAIEAATARIQKTPLWGAMLEARERIAAFHEKQKRQTWLDTSQPGEMTGQVIRPLGRVGIYVPGGQAAYPSTVLMAGAIARVAGVPSIALTTPPQSETGLPPDATLAAAHLVGIQEVYAMGGAQAVACFAYGTQSISRVDKIVGPGNIYVNIAKRLVYGYVGLDMLAGPSEVGVLADKSSSPETIAREIIAQTEHDPHNAAVLACDDAGVLAETLVAIEAQLATLPRAGIVRASLKNNSFFVKTKDLGESIAIINAYAPEHLHVLTQHPWDILGRLTNAGAILLGPHSSAAHGDYVAGPSHILPTAGCARFASPLHLDDFTKKQSIIALGQEASVALAESARILADFEGLEGHARSAKH
jgi:histidinol dehydrogenase